MYKVIGEVDRPSWGVHGGHYKLSSTGRKVIEWVKDNEDAVMDKAIEMDKANRSPFLSRYASSVRQVLDFGVKSQMTDEGGWDEGISMAEHEMDMFNEFADVYNAIND